MMLLLLPALLLSGMEPAHAGPQNFTVVQHWNAYQLPPDRHAPTPAGPVTNISSLAGCVRRAACSSRGTTAPG
jgi:hypothetical protein